MACHGARRLLAMTDNLFAIIGIEAITAAQGVEFRAPLTTSPKLVQALQSIRRVVARLQGDRYLAGDFEAARDLVSSGRLNTSIPDGILPSL